MVFWLENMEESLSSIGNLEAQTKKINVACEFDLEFPLTANKDPFFGDDFVRAMKVGPKQPAARIDL